MPSLNEIFSKREKYLPKIVKQLERRKGYSHLPILGGDPVTTDKLYGVDWRRLSIEECQHSPIPIFDLTGWGSGWEGTLPLAFSLCCEGYETYLLSLPGYGNSENPPPEFYKKRYFQNAASTILAFCNHHEIYQAYFIGHSMAAQILAELASINPDLVAKLVLLCPSGIERNKRFPKIRLIYDFSVSGIKLRRENQRLLEQSGEEDYLKPLIDWCLKQENPWGKGRKYQRWHEFNAICKNGLLRSLISIKEECDFSRWPIRRPRLVYISGESDSVFPAFDNLNTLWEIGDLLPKLQGTVLAGVPHNPTLFHSEITAAAIAHFLEG